MRTKDIIIHRATKAVKIMSNYTTLLAIALTKR